MITAPQPLQPLFELRGPNGEAWTLWEDGRVAGFPDGTVVINRAKPVLDELRCRVKPYSGTSIVRCLPNGDIVSTSFEDGLAHDSVSIVGAVPWEVVALWFTAPRPMTEAETLLLRDPVPVRPPEPMRARK